MGLNMTDHENTTTAAVVGTTGPGTLALADRVERLRDTVNEAHAENTRRAYSVDWKDFQAFCLSIQVDTLPATPEAVMLYIDDMANERGLSVATIRRRLASIAAAHRAGGADDPTKDERVRLTWRGTRRTVGTAQRQAAAVLPSHISAMLATMPEGAAGLRDKALLLVGFTGAFRRSELVAVAVEDIEWTPSEARVTVRRSKTDQEGVGQVKKIPTAPRGVPCPVKALRAWLEGSGVERGPIFRAIHRSGRVAPDALTPQSVGLILKRAARRAGLDASVLSGHSLRAGFVTAAVENGANDHEIMDQTGHKSSDMVRRYRRQANAANAARAALRGFLRG